MHRHAGAEVVGLCHGMMHVQRELARFAGVPFEETTALYCGLNHLTWIYDLRRRRARTCGRACASGCARSAAARRPRRRRGDLAGRLAGRHEPVLVGAVRPLRRLPRGQRPARHRVLPAALRPGHLLRQDARGRRLRRCPRSSSGASSATRRCAARRRARSRSTRRSSTARAATRSSCSTSCARSMGDRRELFSVNVPNRGEVPGMPLGAVLEIPGVATARGLRPLQVPDLPEPLAAILRGGSRPSTCSSRRRCEATGAWWWRRCCSTAPSPTRRWRSGSRIATSRSRRRSCRASPDRDACWATARRARPAHPPPRWPERWRSRATTTTPSGRCWRARRRANGGARVAALARGAAWRARSSGR